MKKTLLVSCLSIASTAALVAAPETDRAQLQSYPKNLARQHLGANLYQYQPATQMYSPSQASAAWLDDDITSGWPAMAGKQYYLLALPEAEVINNFFLSARPANGTVSLYSSDAPAAPTATSWVPIAKDVPLEAINEKKMARPFSKLAKYLLVEMNLVDPGPIYSLYVYGEKPAAAYAIRSRSHPIDTAAIFGAYVNENATFNVAGLYAQSLVKNADGSLDIAAQRAIDDNPETTITLGATGTAAELSVALADSQPVSRVAVKVEPGVKGRLEFIIGDGNNVTADATPATPPSILLDGTSARASVDFAPVRSSQLKVRWVPANSTDSLSLAEFEAFAGTTLAANTVSLQGEDAADSADGERTAKSKHDGKDMNDPKAIADGKSGKEDPAGIGALDSGPYLPGALGFPPNLSRRSFLVPPLPPTQPLSPP